MNVRRPVNIIQASEAEWDPAYDFVPICTLPVRPPALVEKYGICFDEKRDDLGKVTHAFVRLGGKLVCLAAYPDGLAQAQLVHVRVQGNEPEPEEVVRFVGSAFGIADEDLAWQSPLLESSRWMLYRVDDNGNEFEMDRFLVRCIAENVAARLQAKEHKQTYLVREA